jgi:hypothetical protein
MGSEKVRASESCAIEAVSEFIKTMSWENLLRDIEFYCYHLGKYSPRPKKLFLSKLKECLSESISVSRSIAAPNDSSLWKCNWINCEGGCGLSGNGICSYRGNWWDDDCIQFIEAKCEHGVKLSNKCKKCSKKNSDSVKMIAKK